MSRSRSVRRQVYRLRAKRCSSSEAHAVSPPAQSLSKREQAFQDLVTTNEVVGDNNWSEACGFERGSGSVMLGMY